MNEPYTPQAAAEKARETFKKASADFEAMARDATVPESVRALAEKTVTQTREAYEKAKDALDRARQQLAAVQAQRQTLVTSGDKAVAQARLRDAQAAVQARPEARA